MPTNSASGVPFKREDGRKKPWTQRYYDATGKVRERSFVTRRECGQFIKNIEGTVNFGSADATDKMRFEELSQRFLADKLRGVFGKAGIRHSTHKSYKAYMEKWIVPKIGSKKVANLTVENMEELMDHLIEGLDSRRSAQLAFTIVKGCLDYAARKQIITNNPSRDLSVTVTSFERKEILIYTREEMKALSQFVDMRRNSNEWNMKRAWIQNYPMFLLLTRCGLRIGECLALQWGDFDAELRTFKVQRSIGPPEAGMTLEQRFNPPKTVAGIRVLSVPKKVTTALKDMQFDQKNDPKSAWLFPTAGKPEKPRNYHNLRRFFNDLCIAAEVPTHGFHSLRHYYASLLIEQKNFQELANFLGHADPGFTMRVYGHLIDDGGERRAEIAEEVEDAFN